MISDTDTTCTCIISDKGNGIVAHLSSGGLSIICHIISFLMQSVITCRVSEKMEVNKEAFLYGTIFCVSNLCQQSLRKPLTFSFFLQILQKCFPVWLCLKSTFFFLPGRDHWGGFFSSFFTYFNLHWVAQPYPETNSHLHLYRKMHCMERIFISCRFFLIQF